MIHFFRTDSRRHSYVNCSNHGNPCLHISRFNFTFQVFIPSLNILELSNFRTFCDFRWESTLFIMMGNCPLFASYSLNHFSWESCCRKSVDLRSYSGKCHPFFRGVSRWVAWWSYSNRDISRWSRGWIRGWCQVSPSFKKFFYSFCWCEPFPL